MAIALSRFKISSLQIAEALRSGDASALRSEQLATLLDILPSAESLELVRAYEGPPEALGEAERFVLAVDAVPRHAELTRSMLASSTFDEQIAELGEVSGLMREAAAQVRASASLRQTLRLVLALGNQLNTGTAGGGARGFRLSSLAQLVGTKSADGKSTLLHYVAKCLHDEEEAEDSCKDKDESRGGGSDAKGPLALVAQMSTLRTAARVEWKAEEAKLKSLAAGVAQVRALLDSQASLDDRFRAALGAFAQRAEEQLQTLRAEIDETGALLRSLSSWLGQPPSSAAEAPFSLLAHFVVTLEQAHRFNLERSSKAERPAPNTPRAPLTPKRPQNPIAPQTPLMAALAASAAAAARATPDREPPRSAGGATQERAASRAATGPPVWAIGNKTPSLPPPSRLHMERSGLENVLPTDAHTEAPPPPPPPRSPQKNPLRATQGEQTPKSAAGAQGNDLSAELSAKLLSRRRRDGRQSSIFQVPPDLRS